MLLSLLCCQTLLAKTTDRAGNIKKSSWWRVSLPTHKESVSGPSSVLCARGALSCEYKFLSGLPRNLGTNGRTLASASSLREMTTPETLFRIKNEKVSGSGNVRGQNCSTKIVDTCTACLTGHEQTQNRHTPPSHDSRNPSQETKTPKPRRIPRRAWPNCTVKGLPS